MASLLQKKISPSRINYVLKRLQSILGSAIQLDYLLSNPLKNLTLLKEVYKQKEYWSNTEIYTFLKDTSHQKEFDIYLSILNTGMRKGEALGLCWDCIDFEKRLITVKRQLLREGLVERTKSKRPRTFGMNETMFKMLSERFSNRSSLQYVFPETSGQPYNPTHFQRKFDQVVKKINIKRICFKNMRTTFACCWCMNGGDIFALSKILGHSSVDITIKNYADLHPSYMTKISDTIEFNLESASPYLAHENSNVINAF